MDLPPEPASTNLPGERSTASVIVDSAMEAAWRALILIILGNVAVSLVGGIFHDMIPSPPPGFGGAEAGTHSRSQWDWSSQWLHRNAFLVVFLLLFGAIVSLRFSPAAATAGRGPRSRRLRKIKRVILEDWFSLFVWNAFGAMIAATVAIYLQGFSSTQFFLHEIFGVIGPPVYQGAATIFGEEAPRRMDAWFTWYGQNQPKFTFWLLYFAAICDDLGVPNIKTLGRWIWRPIRNRSAEKQPRAGASPR